VGVGAVVVVAPNLLCAELLKQINATKDKLKSIFFITY